MTQGWVIDVPGELIIFNEPPANTAAIVVTETAASAINATDVWAFGAWGPLNGYPREVEFYSDRLAFASTILNPQTMWFTKTGGYDDHGRSTPILDSDAISITINARQINRIQELVPLADLVVMTSSAEWKMTTGQDGIVGPGKVGFKPQTFYGTSGMAVPVVGNTAIFVQSRSNVVRDMSYEFSSDGYSGNDLTIYASHLVKGRTLVDQAFQQAPYSSIWLVRDDGVLLCLTYVREQEVVGWSVHTTDGLFRSVCTVPDGTRNALYVTVERVIDGVSKLYLEVLDERDLTDQRDAFFVDCGLRYDGRVVVGTQTLTGGVTWEADELLVMESSEAMWVGASDEGDQVRLYRQIEVANDEGGFDIVNVPLRVRIIDYVDSTHVNVIAIGDVHEDLRATAISTWELMRDTMIGLDHLEGKTVSILADGEVQQPKTVVGGAIALDGPAAVVAIGLPYRALVESLDVNVQGQETVRDRPKLISKVALLVEETRGLKSGPDLGLLDDFKLREFEAYEDPIALQTGILDVNTSNTWDKNGRFVVVQDDPLPATILSMTPDVNITGVG